MVCMSVIAIHLAYHYTQFIAILIMQLCLEIPGENNNINYEATNVY